jgi:hypothetical protein
MRRYSLIFDLVWILLFVAIGRSAHQHGVTFSGMALTTWPFAVGLTVGWVLTWRRRRTGDTPLDGFVIVLITVAVGMVLRVVSGQGTAFAFILVAIAFLSLFMVGWRLVAKVLINRR